ncbi:hypothetical protein F0Q45_25510 [Mycobacterium simiae]|uniref:Uncharacterized protein n=2 Tax=Mycobacterium simiae TaxID=1784 RepID=A0A5B1B4B4_MYCSI|nr:hypothetical protein F0Q45_25510 [Mycobacterium simiae]
MLGGLSVPLSWGTAVPPDDYDHWAKEDEAAVTAVVPGAVDPEATDPAAEEWDEWAAWREWEAENAEPRFEVPRTGRVVPTSPAAG